LQDPPKFTQILIFGLKIHHLATVHNIDAVSVSIAKKAFCVSHQPFRKNELSKKMKTHAARSPSHFYVQNDRRFDIPQGFPYGIEFLP
jgi:hypothetical protein